MLKLIISLSVLSIDFGYATTNSGNGPQTQIATLHERMNQMINALYSSPLLAKSQPSSPSSTSTSSSTEYPPSTSSYETSAYSYPCPVPQVIYVSPVSASPGVPGLGVPNPYYTFDPIPPSDPLSYPYSTATVPASIPYSFDHPYPNYGPPIPPLFSPTQPVYSQPLSQRDYYHPEYPPSVYKPYAPPAPPAYPPTPALYPPSYQSRAFPAPTYPAFYAGPPPHAHLYMKHPITV